MRFLSVPFSPIEQVTEVLHGVSVADPYRWLEDQNSARTRTWIDQQTRYARAYFDTLPGRDRIRERVRQLLDVETYDAFLKRGTRYFFRKRRPGEQQPSIYFRDGMDGQDQLLIDPAARGTGPYAAVRPLRISWDGKLLLYEIKHGGERMGRFEILDIAKGQTLPDSLPRGFLRGFTFSTDGRSFYYSHEPVETKRPFLRAAYQHVLGAHPDSDRAIFTAGEDENLRVAIVSGPRQLGILVYRFLDKTYTDFYLCRMGGTEPPIPVVRDAEYNFTPGFLGGRIVAATDRDALNFRIVEVQPRKNADPLFFNLVSENDSCIRNWTVTANRIVVFYTRGTRTAIQVFDSSGKPAGEVACDPNDTVDLAASGIEDDDLLLQRESFVRPPQVDRYSADSGMFVPWSRRSVPFDSGSFAHTQVSYPAKDGTPIPIFLVARRENLSGGPKPVVMTSYGGYGIPMTPRFSVFVTSLMERGCVFALPCIRGGSEFGSHWHAAAKRRNRQVAIDDFLSAAQWLVESGKTELGKLASFGGSNSGLLIGAALTQRPDLFRAVLCMVPMLDMLRYHLFDNAHVWKEEYGTAEDAEDFAALSSYSPYHHVRQETSYPATMIVSGDADQNCNPLHARKMTARLQAANAGQHPVLLDYDEYRGHSPVLPLATRVEALTNRLAFVSKELGLPV